MDATICRAKHLAFFRHIAYSVVTCKYFHHYHWHMHLEQVAKNCVSLKNADMSTILNLTHPSSISLDVFDWLRYGSRIHIPIKPCIN